MNSIHNSSPSDWHAPDHIIKYLIEGNLDAVTAYSKTSLGFDEDKFWGKYYNTFESDEMLPHPEGILNEHAPSRKEKLLIINPGERLTPQTHKHKTEFWYALTDNISFRAGTSLDDMIEIDMLRHETAVIRPKIFHHLLNKSSQVALLYEVQTGYCHEADVVRYELEEV